MATWSSMKFRITASVRTTSRINALLSDSMIVKRKAFLKTVPTSAENETEQEKEKPTNECKYFCTNFSMEMVYKLIETAIEERMTWDRFSRSYDSWRSLQMGESLAADIRDRVKLLNHKRHRIICILTIMEKQNQGISSRMRYLMDEKMDNFTNFVYERPTYFMVVTLFLVYKD